MPRATNKRGQGQTLTDAERETVMAAFLETFRHNANVTQACRAVGIDRRAVVYWREHFPEFAVEFRDAEQEANDNIRAEIFRRAVEGNEEPLLNNGRLIRDEDGRPMLIRKYSDQLLMFLARARMTEFREKQQLDVTSNGETVGVAAPYELIRKAITDQEGADAAIELAERIINHC